MYGQDLMKGLSNKNSFDFNKLPCFPTHYIKKHVAQNWEVIAQKLRYSTATRWNLTPRLSFETSMSHFSGFLAECYVQTSWFFIFKYCHDYYVCSRVSLNMKIQNNGFRFIFIDHIIQKVWVFGYRCFQSPWNLTSVKLHYLFLINTSFSL